MAQVDVIDLRSDTATRPTPEMREAMLHAPLGDEQRREDPTVLELEELAARLLGQAAAVYLPTATMGNQIGIRILTRPGDEILAEESSHLFAAELGGAAVHSGLSTRPIEASSGRFTAQQVRAKLRDWGRFHTPRTTLLAVEDTHNASGGSYWRPEELSAVIDAARDAGLKLHLDGARVFNAAVARGRPAAQDARQFDTVCVCLSKGLGAPLGAVLAGSEELMERARLEKHRFGGAMRQAGVVAAAGLYALRHHVDRLASDHARARRLAEGLAASGVGVRLDRVETNFVQVEVGTDPPAAARRLAEHGVLLSGTLEPAVFRAVTHLDIGDQEIDAAIERIPRALASVAA
ncbi:MAG TPA: GntG family PLP-dependent aldolase [Solirubrobacteraceae bacterium]